MRITVAVAGVRDPKWPFDGDHARVLSPFDGSALEVALKLKDADPTVQVRVLVFGQPGEDALVRSIIALKADQVIAVHDPAHLHWDLAAMARRLWAALRRETPDTDLLLLGRQFGDLDDGSVPPGVAALAQRPFVRMAQALVRASDGAALCAIRERGTRRERIVCPHGAIVSISNERGNRLRYPLMKNVMLSRKIPVRWSELEGNAAAAAVDLLTLGPKTVRVAGPTCQWIDGAGMPERAARLAGLLREALS